MIAPEEWLPSGGLNLEPNALAAAIEQRDSLALTAGPGSGKTEMLAQRADFLLRTDVCSYPKRILAISFKVDASANLRERVQRRCGLELGSRLDSHTFHAFAKRLIDRFRSALSGEDELDPDYSIGSPRVTRRQIEFGDLVPLATKILESNELVLRAVQHTYSHVFLDEFQDCTSEQYGLVKTAFANTPTKLTAVGDTKQSIMGWAGALEGIFLRFASDFGARGLNLYQNYRSLPRLRRMQNEMVKIMDPPAALRNEALLGEEGLIDVLRFTDSAIEASRIAGMVASWIRVEKVSPAEIAILVSKQPNLYAERLMAELDVLQVRYRNESDIQDLACEPVSQLIVDYLLILAAARSPDAYARLMATLVAGIEEDDLANGRNAWDEQFVATRNKYFTGVPLTRMTLEQVVRDFFLVFGVDSIRSMSSEYEQGERLAEVVRLTIDRISESLAAGGSLEDALAKFGQDDHVRIMTIHKSKGLEFDSVVILGVEAEAFWGKRVEERASYFVGISRAKRRLVLTFSSRRERPPSAKRWDVARRPHDEFLSYAEAVR